MRTRSRRAGVLMTATCCLAGWLVANRPVAAIQSQEEFARRQYDSGLAFLAAHKYSEALKDFEAVASGYPNSAVADDALLEIIRYHLDVADDPQAAKTTTDELLKKYPSSDSAPMTHIMAGRIVLAGGRRAEDIDTAVASFERVTRLFPGTAAVPVAMYYAGESLRLGKRPDDAMERFRAVATDYPRSPWAARALLGAARCLVTLEQPLRAAEDLQRVRLRFPNTPEATTAIDWNSIIYRLYVRNPVQPPYVFNGRGLVGAAGKLRDVFALAVGPDDSVFVANKNVVMSFDPAGKVTGGLPVAAPRGVFFDRRGPVAILKGAVQGIRDSRPVSLAVPKPDGTPRLLEDIPAVVARSDGDFIVADQGAKSLARFSPSGKHLGPFASVDVDRLAINVFDEIAALPRNEKAVVLIDREGRLTGKIAERGDGYELKNPVDLAYDALGHLYVLDRGRGAVLIVSPKGKLVATFAPVEKGPGAFREGGAIGLDSAGRLYIFDGRAERIHIFQ